jgi:pyruvate dehydrogenase E2 component (dihydrolipoamide acetyltransferase)
MAQPVIVPRESEEMDVCRILSWHVARGDRVRAGDLLCEVDTGKAAFDLEAPVEGTVLDIFFGEGEEAPLLTPIAVLGEEGEEYEALRPVPPGSGIETQEPAENERVSRKGSQQHQGGGQGSRKSGTTGGFEEPRVPSVPDKPRGTPVAGERRPAARGEGEGRILASPRARRLAARQGISLDRVSGSGPGGAVVEGDLLRWLRRIGRET